MALRSARCVAIGLPCLAHPTAEPACAPRRFARGSEQASSALIALMVPGGSGGRHQLRPASHRTAVRAPALRVRSCWRNLPKDDGPRSAIAPNTLGPAFCAERPNQRWIADFTDIWTAEGLLNAPAVIDLFSRRVVGLIDEGRDDRSLVTDALLVAIWRRGKPDALLSRTRQGREADSTDRRGVRLRDVSPVDEGQDERVEARKAELIALLADAPVDTPGLLPSAASIYASKVTALAEALNLPEERPEASTALRMLIEKIMLTPGRSEARSSRRCTASSARSWPGRSAKPLAGLQNKHSRSRAHESVCLSGCGGWI